MTRQRRFSIGLDFGTESVRAVVVNLTGGEAGSGVAHYKHGQITEALPTTGKRLPHDFALQHPADWIDSAARATRSAMRQASATADDVIGIGVDFTSCTMLPCLRDATPLCEVPRYAKNMYAWPKLWKHHGAKTQTDRMNAVARERNEPWLARYGGVIGLEWFFPKILETLEAAPQIYEATQVWIEGGDWFVRQLVGGEADELSRSTCQAGYKAMWNAHEGYPSSDYFGAVHPNLADVVRDKMPGRLLAPGQAAGGLCEAMAKKFRLRAGTPVSAAIIDAHAGVPGAGAAEAGTLVMVLGTSSCHMLNAKQERLIPGVAGVVDGGILPGFFGYETGQAAVGDAFDWLRRLVGHRDFSKLAAEAAKLPPGAEGVMCVDWMNGCRTPLMDGSLGGVFTGLTLNHRPGHLYRALLEASAFGLRWIVELLRDGGVPVKKLVATGGLPHHNPLVVQVYADALAQPIEVAASKQGPALGAAILGALAAGKGASGFGSPAAAIRAMATPRKGDASGGTQVISPDRRASRAYDSLYERYRALAEYVEASGGK